MTRNLQGSAFIGVLRYEFWMQVRRPALWIAAVLVGLFALRSFRGFYLVANGMTTDMRIGDWAGFLAGFYPLAAGLLLADRFARDRKLHTAELLATSLALSHVRLWGKWAGTVLATLIPATLIYLLGVVAILQYAQDFSRLPFTLLVFLANNGTAVVFVGAFTLACTTFMWPILYQFLFVGYWFWGNFLSPQVGIPTINGTLLTAKGSVTLAGLFPSTVFKLHSFSASTATVAQGLGSLVLLWGCAALAQLVAWRGLAWYEQHQ
jgi:ABC-2 type transport system permease protein